jgi:uncharacterized membrane protein YoaK (UPF0700 family)
VFSHEGPARSEGKNAVLAGYLAFIGGYVNSTSFVLLGIFTSHVTGNVGRLSIDVARHDLDGAAGALTMLAAFFAGTIVASVIIESALFRSRSWAYGTALALEALVLLVFLLLPEASPSAFHLHDAEAAFICASMGLQNSLVTRLSGAVVRTTHLTGVVTDLGIEVARWLRWWRARLAQRLRVRLVLGSPERPAVSRVRLLAIITSMFGVGATAGAFAATALGYRALALPVVTLAAAAAYAFAAGRARSS